SLPLKEYEEERVDTVLLGYASHVSALRQGPVVRILLPGELPQLTVPADDDPIPLRARARGGAGRAAATLH
ncbi:MAG: hypothetical protein M3256_26570, partial [Actinomycetota bacterium]|nr:hypothetical protein [Actinomycetota bacterium]